MSSSRDDYSYRSFCKNNIGTPGGRPYGPADYVHAVTSLQQVHPDLLIKLMELVFPRILAIDDLYFVEFLYSKERHQQLVDVQSGQLSVQFWMNNLLVNDLADGSSLDQIKEMANYIARGWQLAIDSFNEAAKGAARVVVDNDSDDVFVVID